MRVIAVATLRDKQKRARFAHPNLNEGRLDIEPLSDDSCIDAGGALFKLHYGHGLRCASKMRRARQF